MAFAGRFSPSGEPGSGKGELATTADRELFLALIARAGATRLAADIRRSGGSLDAEGLLARLTNSGAAGLGSLSGDYALALIDEDAPRLTLALAPLTELELHYHWDGKGTVHFATHLPDLLGKVAAQLDVGAMARAMGFAAFAEDPRSLYRDVYQVQPGTLVHFEGGERRIERFWSLASVEPWTGSENAAAARLRGLLEEAVSQRLSAIDGSTASLLSRGATAAR